MYKDYILGKKAVLFDLDGTIVDNLKYWVDSANIIAAGLNQTGSIYDGMIYRGRSLKDMWSESIREWKNKTQKSPEELAKETIDEYIKLISDPNVVLEARNGFWSLLDELKDKNFLTGLVSNSSRNVIEFMLQKLDINIKLFDTVVSGDEVRHKKPHPEIYITAAKQLKIHPKEILVFEDSPLGALSAKKAGMDLLIIWSGDITEFEYPEKVLAYLDDFSSLPNNLDKTFAEYFKEMAQRAAPPGVTIQ